MVKDMKFSMLNDYYGGLLTEHQTEILRLYYDNDMSLGEIGDSLNITRQGVREVVVRAEEKLNELENKLMLVAKVTEIAEYVEKSIVNSTNAETKAVLKELLSRIKEI